MELERSSKTIMAINKMAYAVNTQTVIWPYLSLFQTKNFKTEPY